MFVFQVIGAFWYFFSIQRETACWHLVCGNRSGCGNSFSCANTDSSVNSTLLHESCPVNAPNTTKFYFGIFLEALQSGIAQSSNLPQKLFYCFWWGLRNLSSFGQGLQTSNYLWESCFSIFISILGLLLFLYFLENLKTYIKLATKSSDKNGKTSKEEHKNRRGKREEKKRKRKDQLESEEAVSMFPTRLALQERKVFPLPSLKVQAMGTRYYRVHQLHKSITPLLVQAETYVSC
ncbi:cyclic nucleotide-gated ion channel 1-like [Quercus lobata]|uniref:cyclic nucleotide-gated ion channel 1-like n=1 Tax=Quercus lobata TaxID=97700 RepID=UPI001246310D|nr:cyclic nucleotide-gated ion channel 1-like [Quercus lobata]